MAGTLIAFDGPDSHDQFGITADNLRAGGHEVVCFDFPQLGQPSGYFVTQFQAGAYGQVVNPYTAAAFYALDRYQSAAAIRTALAAGKVVLVHHYSGSNAAELGVTITSSEERRGFYVWHENQEELLFAVPRADISIVLCQAGEHAQAYDELCQLFPKDYWRPSGSVATNQQIMERLEALLPQSTTKTRFSYLLASELRLRAPITALDYFVPSSLDNEVSQQYCRYLDRILEIYQAMATRLDSTSSQAYLQAVLPVSTLVAVEAADLSITKLSAVVANEAQLTGLPVQPFELAETTTLQTAYADTTGRMVELIDVWPRNELDLVADILYQSNSLPLRSIRELVGGWSYDQKVATLSQGADSVSDKSRYTWDILDDFQTYTDYIAAYKPMSYQRQQLTPRYGYAVPEQVDAAGLTDEFEECFDLSLQLHSLLEAQGYRQEAQYATLLGHRVRWTMTTSAQTMTNMQQQQVEGLTYNSAVTILANQMGDIVAEKHPLTAGVTKLSAS